MRFYFWNLMIQPYRSTVEPLLSQCTHCKAVLISLSDYANYSMQLIIKILDTNYEAIVSLFVWSNFKPTIATQAHFLLLALAMTIMVGGFKYKKQNLVGHSILIYLLTYILTYIHTIYINA